MILLMTLPDTADGSEDSLIKIKGLGPIVVVDYMIRDKEIEGYEHREIPTAGVAKREHVHVQLDGR